MQARSFTTPRWFDKRAGTHGDGHLPRVPAPNFANGVHHYDVIIDIAGGIDRRLRAMLLTPFVGQR